LGGAELKLLAKSRLKRAVLVLAFFSILIPHIGAQVEPEEQPVVVDPYLARQSAYPIGGDPASPAATGSSASTFSIIRTLLVLVFAAAAIYGVVYLFKKAARRKDVVDPFLKVLASTPLSSGQYAHVISVGSRAWLVGASDGGVNCISEITEKDILDALFLEDSRKDATGRVIQGKVVDFKTMLKRLGLPVKSGKPGPEEIKQRRERLKGL